MDKKTKILFGTFAALIAIVVTVTFCKYFLLKDYYIEAQADCDPESEACFIWECDPETTEEGEKCTGDPEEDIWYYQIVKKKAYDIPLCDPNDETCDALACHSGEDCEVTFCDEDNEEGLECNDPVKYLEENPPEDETEEGCVPEDEECLSAQEEDPEECEPDDEECLDAEESGSKEGEDEEGVEDEASVSGNDRASG